MCGVFILRLAAFSTSRKISFMPNKILRSFRPFADKTSKVLILGTMPGPTALRKQEYYGFSGNHFWKIMGKLFEVEHELSYSEKIALLKRNSIALWDIFHSCKREGAADNAIQAAELNRIPGLLKKFPGIKTIFLNGRTAEKTFRKHFAQKIKIPAYYLPSTSPAHAGLSFSEKLKAWTAIRNELKS